MEQEQTLATVCCTAVYITTSKIFELSDTCYVTTSTRDLHYDDGRVEVVQGDYVNLPYVKVNCTE